MRTYPALDVRWPAPPGEDVVDLLLAAVDDWSPVAVEEQLSGVRVFFGDAASRDAARHAVLRGDPSLAATPIDVDDENWAERSQAALRPVTVGRLVVTPPWAAADVRTASAPHDAPIVIVIQPSMGFGTGHHASTRLCLRLLERHLPAGASVVDVGTGSGVLAIAAVMLGASRARAIDVDRDALASAAENIALNDATAAVSLDLVDITDPRAAAALTGSAGMFDLALANITAATLQSVAPALAGLLAPGSCVVVSGFQDFEAEEVGAALEATGLAITDRADEDSWVALLARRP